MIPTSTNVKITAGAITGKFDAAAVFVASGKKFDAKSAEGLGTEIAEAAGALLSEGVSRGKASEVSFGLLKSGKPARRVYVVGLGRTEKITTETVRRRLERSPGAGPARAEERGDCATGAGGDFR